MRARPRHNVATATLIFFIRSSGPLENHSLRVHTRVPGEEDAAVHGLQGGRAPRCQSRVPVIGIPVRAHAYPARHIQKGRDVRLQEDLRRETGLETLRALVGFQRE